MCHMPKLGIVFRVLLALGLALIWLIPALPVYAQTIEPPGNFDPEDEYYPPLETVYVTHNTISPGDMFIYFPYNLYYKTVTSSNTSTTTNPYTAETSGNTTEYSGTTSNTTQYAAETVGLPTIAADRTFVFRLFNTDNSTEIGHNYVFPFREGGYNRGIGSIYLPPEQAPTWEGEYILSIQGIPGYFSTLPDYRVTLNEDNYTTYTSQTNCRAELRANILKLMHNLTMTWGIPLTTQSGQLEVLTQAGANYLQSVMPGIQYVITDLFESYLSSPDYKDTHVWGMNEGDNYSARFDAHPWVGNMTAGIGGILGGSARLGAGMIVAGLAIFSVVFAATKYQSVLSGFIGGILVLMCGYLVGWLPVVYFGLICFALILYTSFTLWLNRT